MAGPPYVDDETILDDADLWRRITPVWIVPDENRGAPRVSSAAFDDSDDGSPMAVLLAQIVLETGRNERHVLAAFEGYCLAALKAGVPRANQQGITRTPTPEEPAHGSVFGPKGKAIRRRLAQAATWVVSPSRAGSAVSGADQQTE